MLIPGPVGELEILTAPAKEGVALRSAVAIICHPHPLYSGTMHNKVVTTLARIFSDLGLPTVRFNFRGVGKSTGEYGHGVGEIQDLLAVIEWAKIQYPQRAIWLAGFSFGACVSLQVAMRMQVAQLVSIAPPIARCPIEGVPALTCPWVVVQGEQDEIVDAEEVFAWVEKLNPQPDLIRLPEAGHFFHKKLLILREQLENLLSSRHPL